VVSCFNGLIVSLFLFLASRVNRYQVHGRFGELFWGWGSLVVTLGLFLLSMQGLVSPWLGIIVADALLFGGYSLIDVGLRIFVVRQASWGHLAVLFILYLAGIALFTFARPSAQLRIIIFSMATNVVTCECASSCLATRREIRGMLPWLCAGVFVLLAAFSLVRAAISAFVPVSSLFQSNVLTEITFVLFDAGMISWSLGLILLRNAELNVELAKGEALYRGIFENANIGIFQSSDDGVFLRMNRSLAALLGYDSPESLLADRGSSSAWIFEKRDERRAIMDALREKGHLEDIHLSATRRDGSMVHASVNCALVEGPGGRAIVTGTVTDITRSWDEKEALRRQNEEKSVLLREFQHRVKNGISIISSLVSLEAGRAADPEASGALTGLGNRVGALASLYDQLYRTADFHAIALDEYLSSIVGDLTSSYGLAERGIEIVAALEPLSIDAKRAESVGLVAVELLTDAIKHAFPGGRRGRVDLVLRKEGEGSLLEVSDDGVGLPEGFCLAGSRGLGMTIVDMLASQLHGRIEAGRSPSGGALFRLTF
jgi:PAS domain S-box-containing protein